MVECYDLELFGSQDNFWHIAHIQTRKATLIATDNGSESYASQTPRLSSDVSELADHAALLLSLTRSKILAVSRLSEDKQGFQLGDSRMETIVLGRSYYRATVSTGCEMISDIEGHQSSGL